MNGTMGCLHHSSSLEQNIGIAAVVSGMPHCLDGGNSFISLEKSFISIHFHAKRLISEFSHHSN